MSEQNTVKPGYKTTEFWLSAAAALVGLLTASGIIATGSQLEQAVGLATSALAALGYSFSRGQAKSS